MRKIALNFLLTIIVFSLIGLGMSLSVKANIGMGSISAVATNVSWLTGVKVGTMTTAINVICTLVYAFVTKWRYPLKYISQIIAIYATGEVMNFFTYQVLDKMVVSHYLINVVLLLSSVLILALGVGLLMAVDFIGLPVETMCLALSQVGLGTFKRIRLTLDVACIILAVGLSLMFSQAMTVREGTVLSALIFAPIAQVSYQWLQKQRLIKKIRLG